MTPVEPLLKLDQLPHNYKPQTIQLYFDGVEVLRIEDGIKLYEQFVPDGWRPNLMELAWDGGVVYALKMQPNKEGESEYAVLINRLLRMVEAAKI